MEGLKDDKDEVFHFGEDEFVSGEALALFTLQIRAFGSASKSAPRRGRQARSDTPCLLTEPLHSLAGKKR